MKTKLIYTLAAALVALAPSVRANWNNPSGTAITIAVSDDDDATVLNDMQQTAAQAGYLTVYLRKTFTVTNPTAVDNLIFGVDYDDGFVAYLNGVEVARDNVTGTPPVFNQTTVDGHEAGTPVDEAAH